MSEVGGPAFAKALRRGKQTSNIKHLTSNIGQSGLARLFDS